MRRHNESTSPGLFEVSPVETSVGEVVARRLIDWGIDTVFGLPGDGINGLMEGFRRVRDQVRFVLVQHEEAAAFMACGYAKATGRIGVCVATSGPGAIHLLNGLFDAKMDHVPVLALTGMQETSVLGTHYQQEVHTQLLYQTVADYNLMVTNPQQVPGVVDIAIRSALVNRTVSHLTFPNDIQVAAASQAPYRHVGPGAKPTSSPVVSRPAVAPDPEDLASAAEVLNAGQKVAVLVGVGARGAGAVRGRGRATLRLHDPVELPQRQVGIGGPGERGEQFGRLRVDRLLAGGVPQAQPVRPQQDGRPLCAAVVGQPEAVPGEPARGAGRSGHRRASATVAVVRPVVAATVPARIATLPYCPSSGSVRRGSAPASRPWASIAKRTANGCHASSTSASTSAQAATTSSGS